MSQTPRSRIEDGEQPSLDDSGDRRAAGPADAGPADAGDGMFPEDPLAREEIESGFALVEDINELNRQINACEAQKLRYIADLHALAVMEPLPPSPAAQARVSRARRELSWLTREDLTAKEVASRLHLSDYTGYRLVRLALVLTSRFTGTLQELRAGNLDLVRAEIIAASAGPLAEDHYQSALAATGSPGGGGAGRPADRWDARIGGVGCGHGPDPEAGAGGGQ